MQDVREEPSPWEGEEGSGKTGAGKEKAGKEETESVLRELQLRELQEEAQDAVSMHSPPNEWPQWPRFLQGCVEVALRAGRFE